MADLPAVRSLGATRDPLGRDAVGVALRSCDNGYASETRALFGRTGGRLLAVLRATGDSGCQKVSPIAWTAMLGSGWTDAKPVLPRR
ncbi:hypothetical protein [Spongiactinospora sp. TRM90649]|uniref:hypothetical protein n=1 Tax=Spongiactinospora sp. TRM90649 TaxID=3031114 RepID=UPI0023F91BC0|nr:hypothetical protein [Spongiactinospora sp. TRM90649]MDF5751543.1 hypothetical protein [Spongiactinospora sp. TRM90649]